MNKRPKGIQDIVDKATRIAAIKDGEIALLKSDLRKARGEKTVTFKMPDTMEITNLPTVQKVHLENTVSVQKVHVENQPETQSVHVLNLKDIKIEKTEVNFPAVQKVEVINLPTEEKTSGWVPEIVKHAVRALAEAWAKRLDKGIEVFSSDEDKLRPQAVIIVDIRGRPVDLSRTGHTIIPMPGGGATSGSGPRPATTINSGRQTVATPGVAVKLISAVTPASKVIITAPAENGGAVYVGASNVSAVSGSQRGLLLNPTGSATLDIDSVDKVWIDAEISGDDVTFTYLR